MNPERFRLLAAVVAAHPKGQVVGGTRLQKTVKLLQRLGLPTDYDYMLHFYGPYSEGLQAEVGLLEVLGLVEEVERHAQNGLPYYVINSKSGAELPEIMKKFEDAIQTMANADPVILEIAVTYDTFREGGMTHDQALEAVQKKKAAKCKNGNDDKALKLLETLNLPSS